MQTFARAVLALIPLLALAAARADAQQTLFQVNGASLGGLGGSSVALLGDQDADGSADLAIGAPYLSHDGLLEAGAVRIVSGKTGAVLATLFGEAAGDHFGFSVCATGLATDAAFWVGAPDAGNGTQSGAIYFCYPTGVFSEVHGSPGDRLGWSIAPAGGTPGFERAIAGAPFRTQGALAAAGAVLLFSSNHVPPFGSMTLLAEIKGTQTAEHLGWSVGGGEDLDHDGSIDVVAGAPDYDALSPLQNGNGRIAAYSGGGSWSLLWGTTGAAGSRLGYSVAALKKANADSFADVVAGAPFAASPGAESGAAFQYSGANGLLIRTLAGFPAGEHAGWAVASAGDFNSDGLTDTIVGAPDANWNGSKSGEARVLSSATGGVLTSFLGSAAGQQLGRSVSGNGDVNLDGFSDAVAAAPNVSTTGGTNAGLCTVRTGVSLQTWLTLSGPATGDQCGAGVADVGDVNLDGVHDWAVGYPHASIIGPPPLSFVTPDVGRVEIRSGSSGALLRTLWGSAAGDDFGFAIDGTGDIDGDGKPDLIVGAPHLGSGVGYARILSGATGAVIRTLIGTAISEQFGYSVAGAGDLDGNGKRDVLVGSQERAYAFEALTGTTLMNIAGAPGDGFGASVAPLNDDTDHDGWGDILVGAPSTFVTGSGFVGAVYVFSKLGGALLMEPGFGSGSQLGWSVRSAGDLNGDGVTDFLAGAPSAGQFALADLGNVRAYSSAGAGATLFTLSGAAGDHYGAGLAGLGDVDLDGVLDFAVGSAANGFVDIVSGKTHTTLVRLNGFAAGDGFGSSIAGLGDLNANGIPDLVVGAPLADATGEDAGLARSIALGPFPKTWTDLGFGLAGLNGVPLLAGTGTLAAGTPGSLSLTSARPNSPALLFVSLASVPLPLKGGLLVANPPVVTVLLTTAGNGSIVLPFLWPSGVPSATKLYFQYAVQDAAAIHGVALSNGLKGLTP